MKQFVRPLLASFAAALLLAACETPAPRMAVVSAPAPTPAPAPADAACNVTAASFAHISARHCAAVPPPGANQFLPAYCTLAGMQNFCGMVQNAATKTRVVQPDGRVRYDANLGAVVGTAGEKCGRLIITSEANGEVVTQFPETANAPMPPACN